MKQEAVQIEIDFDQRHHEFVVEHYRSRFNTTPKKSDLLIAASQLGCVVGTIACGYGQGNQSSFYNVFDVSPSDEYLFKQKHVEFGRWISTINKPKVSEILLSAAVIVALEAGYERAFVQQRPALERILKGTGIQVMRVDAELNLKQVRPDDLSFYVQQTPVLNHFLLADAAEILRPKLEMQIESGIVEVLNIPSLALEAEV